MARINTRKMVTQSAGDIGEFQYWMVMAAATISSGRVTIHCKAY
jgi:hypothetical protein